jgi:hypothetical protein
MQQSVPINMSTCPVGLLTSFAQIINNDKANDGVLLMISSVSCKGHSLTTIWDPGANMSLITHKAARKLGLSGQEITLNNLATLLISTRKYQL